MSEHEDKLFTVEAICKVTRSYQIVAETYEEAVDKIKSGDYDWSNNEDEEFLSFKYIDEDRW